MRLLRVTPILLLASCSLLQQLAGSAFEKPTLQFREARLGRVDFVGAQLDLIFAVTNPNSMGLSLAAAKYSLQVEGHEVVSGMPSHGLQIPPRTTTDIAFPAEVRWNEIAPAIAALFAQDSVRYRAAGEVGIDTPIGVVTLPLEHEGTFASPRMPKLSLGSPQLSSVSLFGARLLLPVTVANPNGFPLPIAGIVGDVTIASAPVAQIAMPEQPPVPPHGEGVVQVPLDIAFVAAGPRVAEAIRTGVAEIALDVTLHAAGVSLPLRLTQTVQLKR